MCGLCIWYYFMIIIDYSFQRYLLVLPQRHSRNLIKGIREQVDIGNLDTAQTPRATTKTITTAVTAIFLLSPGLETLLLKQTKWSLTDDHVERWASFGIVMERISPENLALSRSVSKFLEILISLLKRLGKAADLVSSTLGCSPLMVRVPNFVLFRILISCLLKPVYMHQQVNQKVRKRRWNETRSLASCQTYVVRQLSWLHIACTSS